jgi:putative lipoprotein
MPKPLFLMLALAVSALAACGRSEVPTEPRPAVQPPALTPQEDAAPQDIEEVIERRAPDGSFSFEAYAYDCDGLAVVVRPGDAELMLILPDRSILLPQVEAASGAKYAEGDDGFWGKGIDSAILTLEGEETRCRLDRRETPWVDARARGAVFRGVGQEPGWALEIHPERIVMVYQYGERRVVVPNPGQVEAEGRPVRRWHATTEAHELQVTVEDRACTDIMSGDVYPAKVAVVLDGRNYDGCGRDLD